MKRKSTIIALLIALTVISIACSKSAANMSEDDKHKLFQAAGVTRDNALILEVVQKIGLADSSGQPTAIMQQFVKDHIDWGMKNVAWVTEYNDPAKAKEYVKSHMP